MLPLVYIQYPERRGELVLLRSNYSHQHACAARCTNQGYNGEVLYIIEYSSAVHHRI